jgi:hypothetical protein
VSQQAKAFAKYDLRGEDLAHRIISGAVKASATEQAYALLWLAERGNVQIEEITPEINIEDEEHPQKSGIDRHIETAKSARSAQYLAARAALQSAKSHERVERSARIVNSLALIAIAVSIFALWSEGQKERASIQQTAASAVQMVAEILGQL